MARFQVSSDPAAMRCSALAAALLSATQLLIIPAVAAAPEARGTLRVGITGSPPFVLSGHGSRGGISLEIWRRVAEQNDLSYDLVQQPTPKQGLRAIEMGEIDLLVGPISITARRLAMPDVDFTQPYFLGKSGVLLPLSPPSLVSRLSVFFGWAVVSSVLVLLGVLLAVGSLIWLAERRRNAEQFPRAPLAGIGSGMWFALVTLTTVGYGDKAPVTRTGRGLTAAWMTISLIAVSSLTASLASAFTLFLTGATETAITDPAQLQSRRVAVVSGTSGVELAQRRNMRVVSADSLAGAIDLMLEDRAEAVIFDRPAIRYYLKKNPDLAVRLAPFTLTEETYGFAFRSGDPLRNALNVSILQLQRQGQVEAITNVLLN